MEGSGGRCALKTDAGGRRISGRAGAGCFNARVAFGCVGSGWAAFLREFDGNTGCGFWMVGRIVDG